MQKNRPFDQFVRDLLANYGRSILTVGTQQPLWVQALGIGLNEALENHNATIIGLAAQPTATDSITALAEALDKGKVKTLFVLGGNPAYNAPAELGYQPMSVALPRPRPGALIPPYVSIPSATWPKEGQSRLINRKDCVYWALRFSCYTIPCKVAESGVPRWPDCVTGFRVSQVP